MKFKLCLSYDFLQEKERLAKEKSEQPEESQQQTNAPAPATNDTSTTNTINTTNTANKTVKTEEQVDIIPSTPEVTTEPAEVKQTNLPDVTLVGEPNVENKEKEEVSYLLILPCSPYFIRILIFL